MKVSKAFWFRLGSIALVLIIAVIMFIVGRGHTLYVDNKTYETPAGTFQALYRTDVWVSESSDEMQKLSARERSAFKFMGQSATLNIEYMEVKNGEKKQASYRLNVPYKLDGIVINVPALLAGQGPDIYMYEFVSVSDVGQSAADAEPVITDEFSVTDI